MEYSQAETGRPIRNTTHDSAEAYFAAMTARLRDIDYALVDAYAGILFDAWRDDRQVFVFGNGGSAHTAGHHATDYLKTAAVNGVRGLRAISLADNVGLLTAIANDVDFDDVFRQALEYHSRAGDVAVAISASGNSPNVVKTCIWAREHDLRVVAITGFSGGRIGVIADLHIHIPSNNYGIVEDIQMAIGHVAGQILHARVADHTSHDRVELPAPVTVLSRDGGKAKRTVGTPDRASSTLTPGEGEYATSRSQRRHSVDVSKVSGEGR